MCDNFNDVNMYVQFNLYLCSNLSILHILYFLQDGTTPLHIACEYGPKETAVALIDRGADILMKDNVSKNNTFN